MRDAANEIVVSAATVWEISIKRAIGKLRFDRPIVAAVLALGFEILPVEGAHAEHAGDLSAVDQREPRLAVSVGVSPKRRR